MPHTPHAITSLTLENFRNYASLQLSLTAAPVVLRGKNGAGKTNILEAISLLAPGRGLRGARLREMDRVGVASHPSPVTSDGASMLATGDWRLETAAPWVVAARIVTRGEEAFVGTGRDGESTAEKRIIKINGERVRGHAALAAVTSIQWLTPSMDQIFLEGGSARRKFFDRLVYSFSPEQASHLAAYESAMRERNRLLAEGLKRADPYWLSVLEQQMAEHAVAITLARLSLTERLAHEFTEDIAGFPRAQLRLNGEVEHWLREGMPALEAERRLAERLVGSRPVDAVKGRASHGCHRSEWEVIHSHKQVEAVQCSTGEQKALLLAILLAGARARAGWCGVAPILLLDEVIAHLDAEKRRGLFDLIQASRIQAWMTGTDAGDFTGLGADATVLEIESGRAIA